ncbi:MAG: molybdate ABC transporter substrate-binding protein [Actinomycetes bacterium]
MRIRSMLPVLALVGLMTSCGQNTNATPETTQPTTTAAASGSITVFAAASLKGTFTTIGSQFEAANPGATVTFNFGGSSSLATQITQGAPADVFASASNKTMETVTTAKLAADPSVFAVNSLEIATPTTQSIPVTSLADLATPGIKVAVCQIDVPCGATALALFEKNKVTVTPTSQEPDVKAVMSKVTLGEVDAGIVYVTDVQAAKGSVTGVEIPADQNVTTKYPIATVLTTKQPATATAFVQYLLSPAGQKVMREAGFAAP